MQDQENLLYKTMRLFERAFIVVFSVMIIVSLFYVVGNFQNFTDRTQLELLTTMQSAGGIAFIGAIFALVLELIQLILYRNVRALGTILLLVVGGVVSLGITIGSSGLIVFLGPV